MKAPRRQTTPNRSDGAGRPNTRHCAVYTRKSSEEGLEQEYNSLHAQREACEAYIRSQQHEGWRLVPAAYDDGGLSGGTMARPALQALLAEVRAGRVDVIVVYKVDRLTRSLADFAKMVETFDAAGASFVAVTQQFNTTTSMGRLTLNVLLSFAQFEREVTGERIRDKIAASKRRGMWMGGRTPLGYVVRYRKLVTDAEAAARVVQLYRRYLELGTVTALRAQLDAERTAASLDASQKDNARRPGSSSRGALYALLSNPVYIGQVRHKGDVHPGQHEGIVPAELFAAVQVQLASSNAGAKGRGRRTVEASPLAGKLFDEAGERLVPSHARKGERRYRYYVSSGLLRPGQGAAQRTTPGQSDNDDAELLRSERSAPLGWRLPAQDIEQNVRFAVAAILRKDGPLVSAASAAGLSAEAVPLLQHSLAALCQAGSAGLQDGDQRTALLALVERVEMATRGMTLSLMVPTPASPGDLGRAPGSIRVEHFVPHRVRQRGVEMRLVLAGGIDTARSDPALLKVVARAHCWFDDLVQGKATSAKELAQRLGVDVRYVQRLLRLAMLAPSIVEAIAAGRHDAELTVERLAERGALPLRWSEQVELLRG